VSRRGWRGAPWGWSRRKSLAGDPPRAGRRPRQRRSRRGPPPDRRRRLRGGPPASRGDAGRWRAAGRRSLNGRSPWGRTAEPAVSPPQSCPAERDGGPLVAVGFPVGERWRAAVLPAVTPRELPGTWQWAGRSGRPGRARWMPGGPSGGEAGGNGQGRNDELAAAELTAGASVGRWSPEDRGRQERSPALSAASGGVRPRAAVAHPR
jgi:hypothetical protein